MNDLSTLLDRASASDDPTPVDVAGDLARGRRALSRTRRRRGAVAFAGLAAVSVAGVGISRVVDHDPEGPGTATGNTQETNAGQIQLLAQPMSAGPYTFDTTPEGWVVQGVSPYATVIAPADGSAGDDPDVFIGKLVIMLDSNPPSGEPTTVDGRRFWIGGGTGYTRITTGTLPGEPEGVVMIQFPDKTGWARETMIEFLASVHVGDTAKAGVG